MSRIFVTVAVSELTRLSHQFLRNPQILSEPSNMRSPYKLSELQKKRSPNPWSERYLGLPGALIPVLFSFLLSWPGSPTIEVVFVSRQVG